MIEHEPTADTTRRVLRWVMSIVAALISVQAIHGAWLGSLDITYSRTLLVAAAIAVLLLHHPLSQSGRWRHAGTVFDLGLIALFAYTTHHLIWVLGELDESMYILTDGDVLTAAAGMLIVMEATRRTFGWPIIVVTLLALSMLFAGPYLPGFLHHSGFSPDRAAEMIWFGFQGVYGTPLGVVIQVVLIFIVFGAVLEHTGASASLIRVSLAISGHTRGGPAHAAVIGSAMFGSMSGSVTANVVGTGTFTIPMIKRRGFSAPVAGAIEAAASTGGQIVPPVMGAAAFLMADLLSTSYASIITAALVPALFYYLALFLSISIEARRSGIEPTPVAERVKLTAQDIWASLGFIIPIIVIAAVLIAGYSAAMAGLSATVTVAVLGLFRAEVRNNLLKTYARALVQSGIAAAAILVVVACIGIVIGVMNITGLGISFASMVSSFTSDSLLIALVITAMACLTLGMGMPTLPAYLIIVLVLGPSLQKLGVEPITAHMFVLYFGVLSAITPPVAIGAFAAAPIAQSSPMATSVHALRMAIGGFVIPFVFVFQPLLMLQGDFDIAVFAVSASALAMALWYLSSALAGFSWRALSWTQRGVHLALAAGLLIQSLELQLALLAVGLLKMLLDRRRRSFA